METKKGKYRLFKKYKILIGYGYDFSMMDITLLIDWGKLKFGISLLFFFFTISKVEYKVLNQNSKEAKLEIKRS